MFSSNLLRSLRFLVLVFLFEYNTSFCHINFLIILLRNEFLHNSSEKAEADSEIIVLLIS